MLPICWFNFASLKWIRVIGLDWFTGCPWLLSVSGLRVELSSFYSSSHVEVLTKFLAQR